MLGDPLVPTFPVLFKGTTRKEQVEWLGNQISAAYAQLIGVKATLLPYQLNSLLSSAFPLSLKGYVRKE